MTLADTYGLLPIPTAAPIATTIAAGSNGQSLPQATIVVASAALFPTRGTAIVTTDKGPQAVTFTGTTSGTLTGCSGGQGAMATGNAVLLHEAAGDPGLTVLADYLQTFILTYGAAAWTAIAGASPANQSVPCFRAFTHDPSETEFNERDLPAIFLWRTGSAETPAWIADDYRVTFDTVRVLWVPPAAPQAQGTRRHPFTNAIVKLIDDAIGRERFPEWVRKGDTDPESPYIGSQLLDSMGAWRLWIAKYQPHNLMIGMAGSDPRTYAALAIDLHLEERLIYGTDDPNIGQTATIQDTSAPPLVLATVALPAP
jgi:hypothetical protein